MSDKNQRVFQSSFNISVTRASIGDSLLSTIDIDLLINLVNGFLPPVLNNFNNGSVKSFHHVAQLFGPPF